MKCFKLSIFSLLFFVFTFPQIIYSQNTPLDTLDYIPVHTSPWYGFHEADNDSAIIKMKIAGVDIVSTEAKQDTMAYYSNLGFKLFLTNASDNSSPTGIIDYINYYTNSRYIIWEAEGPTPSNSEAKLIYNPNRMQLNRDGSAITLKSTSADSSDIELIYGPYYKQFSYSPVAYPTTNIDSNYYLTEYNANFKIQLQRNGTLPDSATSSTPLFKIQVTSSSIEWDSNVGGFVLNCTEVKEETVTRGQLTLNQFQELPLVYENDHIAGTSCNQTTFYKALEKKEYVQYKVIWLGNPNYLLSIDKITVSDAVGRSLILDSLNTAQGKIQTQLSKSGIFSEKVVGWIGADEPHCFDQFEPMKKVNQIASANNNFIWYPFVGSYSSVINIPADPFGTYHLSLWKEASKRVGNMNIWQDIYYMHWPWSDSFNAPCNCTDYYGANIDTVAINYKSAFEVNPNFGVSIQCGRQSAPPVVYQEDITPTQLLYETNLALLFGAKFLSLYSYFAQDDVNANSIYITHALVNFNKNESGNVSDWTMIYTDKYYKFKDVISPRLKGLMGRTLKKITPTEQKVNVQLGQIITNTNGFIGMISKSECPGPQYNTKYDLGYFNDANGKNYFMILNRWYNEGCTQTLTININPNYFPDNYNLNIVDLISGTIHPTISKYGYITSTPQKGDASFYSVNPVVKYGGILGFNDTIKVNTTLTENMVINNAVNIIINQNQEYTIQDTITIQGSGFISGPGYFNIINGGEINISSWSNSLFKAKSSNKAKLIWGKYPNGTPSYYKIYKRINSSNWVFLANSTLRYYVDQTQVLPIPYGTTISYKITAVVYGRESSYSNTVIFVPNIIQTREKSSDEIGEVYKYGITQNFPNPFNPTTIIRYELADELKVQIKVYDILGKEVSELVNEEKSAGYHEVEFNASNLASGIYFYRIQAGSFVDTKKMILLK